MRVSRKRLAVLMLAGVLAGCASTTTAATPKGGPGEEPLPSWLLPADACPADVIPALEFQLPQFDGICDPNLDGCVRRCEQRDPLACYAAALRVQELGSRAQLAEALFLRACQLGVSSGCTNRAAGIFRLEPGRPGANVCAARTFEITCDRHDPWGCTMYGLLLATGQGVQQDVDRALAVLPGGCSLGHDDPACVAAQSLIQRLQPAPSEPHQE